MQDPALRASNKPLGFLPIGYPRVAQNSSNRHCMAIEWQPWFLLQPLVATQSYRLKSKAFSVVDRTACFKSASMPQQLINAVSTAFVVNLCRLFNLYQ